ncbi:MAG: hypothetical protein QOH26_1828, partial [Actinomycetota bacterium]|nr:hypothetical protein [Actinomycetota bacterium]
QEVAAAFEAAVNEVQAVRAGAQKPYRSLGEEMGDLLQHAKDSAESTRRAAEQDAAKLLERSTEDSEATMKAVEAQANEIRVAAEKEASQRIEEAAETVAQLEKMEIEAREELRSLRVRLDGLTSQLRALEPQEMSEPEQPAVPPPPVLGAETLGAETLETDALSLDDDDDDASDEASNSLAQEPRI